MLLAGCRQKKGTGLRKLPKDLLRKIVDRVTDESIDCLVEKAVNRCDSDLRGVMYANVVLSGGNMCFRGIEQRVHHALSRRYPGYVNVVETGETSRQHLTWLGGSLLGALPQFLDFCISQKEYEENGARVVLRKFF